MFARFRFKARQFGQLLRVALIALVSVITGCDEKPAWRGIATDNKDTDHSPDSSSTRKTNNVEPR